MAELLMLQCCSTEAILSDISAAIVAKEIREWRGGGGGCSALPRGQ